MDKILTIAWKEIYTTFTNRSLLLLLIVTPLVISLILGFAFGGGGGNLTIEAIPLAVVNLDTGVDETNLGATVTGILLAENLETNDLPACPIEAETDSTNALPALGEILNAERLDNVELARSGVDDGTYAAAVIIPANFSAVLQPDLAALTAPLESVQIEIYGSGANPVSASVVRAITEGIVNQIATGSIAVRASLPAILDQPGLLQFVAQLRLAIATQDDFADFACAFAPTFSAITLDRLPIDATQERSPFAQILIGLGSAQAVFFSLFTANGAVQSIYDDRQSGVLQRLLSTPTPRSHILAGKLAGTLLIVILQIGLLLIALSLIASLVSGALTLLWGTNWLALLALLLATGIGVSGVAVFIAGIARNRVQAQAIGTIVTMLLALLGGAFGFQLGAAQQLSLVYWGVDGFRTLSESSGAIGLHLAVLLAQGVILFAVGSWLFNRRIEV